MNLSSLFGGGAAAGAADYWYGTGNFGTTVVTTGPTIYYGLQVALTPGNVNSTNGSMWSIRNGATVILNKTYEYLFRDNGNSSFEKGILLNSGLTVVSTSVVTGTHITVAYKEV